MLGWDINFSIWVSSLTVAIYVALGGLRSAIFNEVLQFFLIWAGALLIPILGLYRSRRLEQPQGADRAAMPRNSTSTSGRRSGSFNDNPMGIHWTGIVFGLGCGDLVRLLDDGLPGGAARPGGQGSAQRAKMAPIIGAGFKMWCRSS